MHKSELLVPDSIQVGDTIDVDLYTGNGVLLMAAGHKVTKENIHRLFSQDIYVYRSSTGKGRNELGELLGSIPKLEPEPEPEPEPRGSSQNAVSFQESKEVQTKKESAENGNWESTVHALADSLYRDLMGVYSEIYCCGLSQTHERLLVEKVIYRAVSELLTKGPWSFDFNALRVEDNYLQIHSVNVALLSTLMGHGLGYKSEALSELFLAALLHDMGSKQIPLRIINKQESLTPQEFEYVKKHISPECIELPVKVPESVKAVIQQHHERWDGSGYPKGLSQNGIHPFAQIVAVGDVFDALISDRPYRKALSLNDAFEWILSGTGTNFNPEMVKIFAKVITLYPLGAMVELNTGETGRVTKTYLNQPNRPQVRLVFDSMGQYIQDYVIKDLKECLTLFIKNVKYPEA